MEFLKLLFYILAGWFVWYELSYLINPKEKINSNIQYLEYNKLYKGEDFKNLSQNIKNLFIEKTLSALGVLVFLFVGLFTWNWPIFVIYFLYLIFSSPFLKFIKKSYPNFYVTLIWFNSLIGFLLGMFIIINTYHLHINLEQFIL